MPPPKFRGANFMVPKRPKIAYKDRIQEGSWKIHVGDKVQIVGGSIDVGKQGKVVSLVKEMNAVIVEGCKMAFKHVKPNPEHPSGGRIRKELPISYTHVQLIDPATNQPTKVRLTTVFNPTKRRKEVSRVSLATQSLIPVPEEKDEFKEKPEGPLDTSADAVAKETFTINIQQCPFPSAFMNELERMRRKNRESHAC
ncbi:ribosomal protein L24 [Spizellomyces punctatus DAOM BR117]|uniref:Ribosomal protein L24 n=1 Tax=Spizellomyces punctatus (strain DAOM BR117) TaxID=645134 RepID=A0A0L0H8S3_SPIPD|nr:ribosomal protein L24 [Spizellomyces punctatus DAOM BR117]KNC97339.1 ribosomal protein L24 [Spizellomyces punctatus DAOM BR117]|eukprot:XP_016605379.1 ribosomal protein L24 [Spizellomyces punctatus DAOM BR117]